MVTATAGTSAWRLATGASGGWINGWQPDIERTWIAGCVQAAADCGSHLLGDGRMLDQYGIG